MAGLKNILGGAARRFLKGSSDEVDTSTSDANTNLSLLPAEPVIDPNLLNTYAASVKPKHVSNQVTPLLSEISDFNHSDMSEDEGEYESDGAVEARAEDFEERDIDEATDYEGMCICSNVSG